MSARSQFFNIITIVALQMNVINSKISDYTTICSAKDPTLDECVQRSTNEMFKHFINGIPEYNIPSISPYYLKPIPDAISIFTMNMSLYDLKVFGYDHIYITKASVDLKRYTMYFNAFLPNQTIVMKFDVSGKLMLFPVSGHGNSKVSIFDNEMAWKIVGEPYKKNGTTHIRVKDLLATNTPKHMTVDFDNFFNGNTLLGGLIHNVLNENWEDVYKHIKPIAEKVVKEAMTEQSDKIFSMVPYGEIFRDVQV